MKNFWNPIEEFLTTIPDVVLWIMLVLGLSIPHIAVLTIIAIILFIYKKSK